jgi:Na+/H+ antiporter NhaD/arsenite permease-like protein
MIGLDFGIGLIFIAIARAVLYAAIFCITIPLFLKPKREWFSYVNAIFISMVLGVLNPLLAGDIFTSFQLSYILRNLLIVIPINAIVLRIVAKVPENKKQVWIFCTIMSIAFFVGEMLIYRIIFYRPY